MKWFRVVAAAAAVAGTVLAVRPSWEGAKTATSTVSEQSDRDSAAGAYQDRFYEETRSARNDVRREVLQGIVASCIVAAIFTFLVTNGFAETVRLSSLRKGPGVSRADATVIVLGLATVVAALSIALGTTNRRPEGRTVPEFAAESVWAEQTANITSGTAVICMSVALTQVVSVNSREQVALTVLLVGVGLITLGISAAVRTWSGREALRLREIDLDLKVVERRLAKLPHFAARSKWLVARDYVRFSALMGLATASLMLATLALLALTLTRTFKPAATLPLALLAIAIIAATVASGLAYFTILIWQSAASRTKSETAAPVVYVIVWSAGVAGIVFLAVRSSDAPGTSIVGSVILLGSLVLPTILLAVAKILGRGPAVFAVEMDVRATQVRRQQLLGRRQEYERSTGTIAEA